MSVTDMLGGGLSWLEEMRHKYMTADIKYQRNTSTLSIKATIGRTVFQVVDDYGHLKMFESRDFLVRAIDLIEFVEPQVGDQIVEGGFVYEVMSPAGEPEWRFSDANRETMRIHSKAISSG